MLINLSNHPQTEWSVLQLQEAQKQFGSIIDFGFPAIDPLANTDTVVKIADEFVTKILLLLQDAGSHRAVHIMGEHTFVFSVVKRLQQKGVCCIASASRRQTEQLGNETRTVRFDFIRFREYEQQICT